MTNTPIDEERAARLVEHRYNALNSVEQRIVNNYRQSGYSLEEALDILDGDLKDAAEEDGYDGP